MREDNASFVFPIAQLILGNKSFCLTGWATKIPVLPISNHFLYLTDLPSKGTIPVSVMKWTTVLPEPNQGKIFAVLVQTLNVGC
jgi:hypothetical protein